MATWWWSVSSPPWNRERCAALIEGEATVKFFRRTRAGEVFLDPANEAYDPIPVTANDDARVMGKVVTVLRQIR